MNLTSPFAVRPRSVGRAWHFARPVVRTLAAVAIPLVLTRVAPAQTTGYAERFDAPGVHGRVWGLGTWNGQLFAGGPFAFQTGGGRPQHLARFDGRDWQDVGGGLDGPVRAVASYQGEAAAVDAGVDDAGLTA